MKDANLDETSIAKVLNNVTSSAGENDKLRKNLKHSQSSLCLKALAMKTVSDRLRNLFLRGNGVMST